ncbi:predicted protein [Uncinocarpus reesii 1704]|uniref:Uncharacterized protein n=1 Tax=Uncinocarpus reesii (strain UAMH 1704) TaxID=336963 RepID=C4JIA1_UNCRE|nr:uncharacterized protein UREG_02847 [Uncinocarpus reesii 1704]EEP77998.1 predicted protein [Uncinocarpus reesii 1704]
MSGEIHSIHLVLPPGTPLMETSASTNSSEGQESVSQDSTQRSSSRRSQRIQDLLNPAPPQSATEPREDPTIKQDTAADNSQLPALRVSSETCEPATGLSQRDMSNSGNTSSAPPNSANPHQFGQTPSLVPGFRRMLPNGFEVTEPGSSYTSLQGLRVSNTEDNSAEFSTHMSHLNPHRIFRSQQNSVTNGTIHQTDRPTSMPSVEHPQRETSRLSLISQNIIALEEQFSRGIIPTVDEIARLRFQLYQMLDEQYRNPLKPRDPALESWITRVLNLATRADQHRVMKARQQPQFNNHQSRFESTNAALPSTAAYLLKAPNGTQYVVMRPNDQPLPSAFRPRAPRPAANIPGLFMGGNIAPLGAPGFVARLPGNRVFRPPLVRRRYRRYVRPINLVAIIRSFWLFIRLYFISYLFSARGSWLRTLLVLASAVVAVFSETSFPERIQRFVLRPVQQHLENLLPTDGQQRQAQPAAQRPNDTAFDANLRNEPINGRQAQGNPAQAEHGGIWDGLRSLERSVAIFLASFIPGLSERHIAARNAAEVARRNEEQRQQAEEQQPEVNTDPTAPHPQGGTNDPSVEQDATTPVPTDTTRNAGDAHQDQQSNQERADQ